MGRRDRDRAAAVKAAPIAAPAPAPVDWSWVPVALLLAATFAVYAQTAWFEFINYDDNLFVYMNPHVKAGLTGAGAWWALTSNYINWQPLVWLSHMALVSLFGMAPGPHHFFNVLLHAANAVLLFLLLRRMTQAVWPSLVSAALFCLHPLRVQSVAWVSERKDVLSSLFWLVTMWAYLDYVDQPRQRRRYWLVLAAFALGLMSKPMLIPLPVTLLLLDYWPLRRHQSTRWLKLVQEKIPLALLSAVSLVITFAGQSGSGAVATFAAVPLTLRIENALISYAVYLRDLVWPFSLALFYPYPKAHSALQLLAAAVLGAITWLAIRKASTWPWLMVGWLWYLVTLVPVIGIVQLGSQPRADRYTYMPMLFLVVAVVWCCRQLPRAAFLGAAVCAILAALSWVQVSYWRDNVKLYTHAIEVSGSTTWAHNNLGAALVDLNRWDEAIPHFDASLRLQPDDTDTLLNIGFAYLKKEQPEQALAYLQRGLRLQPNNAKMHYQAGRALAASDREEEAVAEYTKALALGVPEDSLAAVHMDFGIAEYMRKNDRRALAEFNEVIRLSPREWPAHKNAAIALGNLGRDKEAVERFSIYLAANPADTEARQAMEALQAAARK